jgi:hypothetical protein
MKAIVTSIPLTASKTPAIIVTEIKMMQTVHKGVNFLVEGDDDIKFWKPRVDTTKVSLVNCEGRPNLLSASQLLLSQKTTNIVGVYDSDFDHIWGISHVSEILTPTDKNDLETTILSCKALDDVLLEFGDDALISAFDLAHNKSVQAHLIEVSQEFGKLRLHNRINNHNVDFGKLSPYRFVSSKDWQLDMHSLHGEYAVQISKTPENLCLELNALPKSNDVWSFCQGHDTVRILAQGLRQSLGKKQISEQDLSRVLRLAFSKESLAETKMYRFLTEMEKKLSIRVLV